MLIIRGVILTQHIIIAQVPYKLTQKEVKSSLTESTIQPFSGHRVLQTKPE